MLFRISRAFILPVSLLAVTATVLVGCGRRGDLDPPSMPVDKQNMKTTPEPQVEDKPFFLDPLL